MTCCREIIEASQTLTACECPPGDGFCKPHGCEKTAHWKELCRTNPEYFAAWARGEGPRWPDHDALARRVGLGDVVARLIRWATLGRVTMCEACDARKAWLNRFQVWPIRWPGWPCWPWPLQKWNRR